MIENECKNTLWVSYILGTVSQFGYCFLVWMFHSRGLNNKINSLRERALRRTKDDKSSSFQDLMRKGNSVSIHHRNIQVLVTEMFKVKNNTAPGNTKELFVPKISPYDLRNINMFQGRKLNSV